MSESNFLIKSINDEIKDLIFHQGTLQIHLYQLKKKYEDLVEKNRFPDAINDVVDRRSYFEIMQEFREVKQTLSSKRHVLEQYIERGNGE